MTGLLDFWRSSIGAKVTMAVTGVVLFGFVIGHLLGNLLLFSGPEAIAEYAEFLHSKPAMLWVVRLGLLTALILHVVTGIRLARANRAARPVPYETEATVQASYASRSMVLTGLVVLAFLVYHLLHFTVGVVHPADVALRNAGFDGHDVYAMVTSGFSHPAVVAAYLVGQIVLFFHLSHGIQSFAQTLGLNSPRYSRSLVVVSVGAAALIAGGNALLALSVLLGLAG